MAFKIREVEILVECFWCVPSSEFPYSLISFLSFHCFVCKAFISHQIRSDLEKKIGNSQVGISSEVLEGRKLHLIYHSVPFITEGKLFNTQCVSGTIWSREEPMARQPHNSQEDTVKTGLIWNHWGIWLTCKCPDATHREATAPHSSALSWRIPGTGEPGGLRSMGSLRVGHDWVTSRSLFTLMHWRRKWQPTPVFLPGESQGRGSLAGCSLWGRTELDATEAT